MNEACESREVELKYTLAGEQDYAALCAALGIPESEEEQINNYFHSEGGAIPGPSGVIRIRRESGRWLFTVKLGGTLSGGLLTAEEYEVRWPYHDDSFKTRPEVLWQVENKGMRFIREQHGREVALVWAGEMTNYRRVYLLDETMRLEVDKSVFPDGFEDFEVELETRDPERDRVRLLMFLHSANITFSPQTKTKYQRFLEHSGKIR